MTTYLSQAQEYYQQKIERTDHPCLGGITKGGAVRGYLKSNDSEDFIPFACELTGAGVKGGLYTARSGNTPKTLESTCHSTFR